MQVCTVEKQASHTCLNIVNAQSSCIICSCIYVICFYCHLMLRSTTSNMDQTLLLDRDPKHWKCMGCRFRLQSHTSATHIHIDHIRAQGSHSFVPKGTGLEAWYGCAHWKVKFHRWMKWAWSLFPQYDRRLWHCRDLISRNKYHWVPPSPVLQWQTKWSTVIEHPRFNDLSICHKKINGYNYYFIVGTLEGNLSIST